MTKFPKLSVPPMEITDPGTLRYGDGFITAEFPEKAYKAWRRALDTSRDPKTLWEIVTAAKRSLAEPRKPGTGRWERTPAHKEAYRKAALKRWAKVRRSA